MGVNISESRKPLLNVLSQVARFCTRSLPQEAQEGARARDALSHESIARLAQHLLEANQHLLEFEIELGNQFTRDAVADVLAARGCVVARDPFKPLLIVTCPEDFWRRAA